MLLFICIDYYFKFWSVFVDSVIFELKFFLLYLRVMVFFFLSSLVCNNFKGIVIEDEIRIFISFVICLIECDLFE